MEILRERLTKCPACGAPLDRTQDRVLSRRVDVTYCVANHTRGLQNERINMSTHNTVIPHLDVECMMCHYDWCEYPVSATNP